MEEKRTQNSEQVNAKKIFDFISDIKSEFKKISWTSREELIVYTKVVVGATFVFGFGVYLMDVFFQNFLAGLNIALRVITG
ncbi:MAG: Protein translocase subunit SecE [Chlamydiae bacterium]|nr:Protein translocase subunit SecE [Chlamydiota bacterium]